jgi:molybdopterin-binding protein
LCKATYDNWKASVEELGLSEGKEAYAVITSSKMMIAVD